MAAKSIVARSFQVSGRVQGVGFRYFVLQLAEQLALRGHVRNTREGAVEVYAIGTPEGLSALGEQLWAGPPLARVDDVKESPVEMLPTDSFQVKY